MSMRRAGPVYDDMSAYDNDRHVQHSIKWERTKTANKMGHNELWTTQKCLCFLFYEFEPNRLHGSLRSHCSMDGNEPFASISSASIIRFVHCSVTRLGEWAIRISRPLLPNQCEANGNQAAGRLQIEWLSSPFAIVGLLRWSVRLSNCHARLYYNNTNDFGSGEIGFVVCDQHLHEP